MKIYRVITTAIVAAGVLLLSACVGRKDPEPAVTQYHIDYSGQKSHYLDAEDSYPAGQEVELYIPETTEEPTETISLSEIMEYEAGTAISEEELESVDTE